MTSGFRLNNAAIAKQNENAPLTGAFSWSLANFQAVFGNLTGGDARLTLWRGRRRPRLPLGSLHIWKIELVLLREHAWPDNLAYFASFCFRPIL